MIDITLLEALLEKELFSSIKERDITYDTLELLLQDVQKMEKEVDIKEKELENLKNTLGSKHMNVTMIDGAYTQYCSHTNEVKKRLLEYNSKTDLDKTIKLFEGISTFPYYINMKWK